MAAWETTWVLALLDRKAPRAVAALEILEAVDGNARCARRPVANWNRHARSAGHVRKHAQNHPVRLLVPAEVGEPRLDLRYAPDELLVLVLMLVLVLVEHTQQA